MEIEWRLTHLQGEYQQRFGKRLTNKQIADETGLSKTTLVLITKGKIKRPDEKTVRLLLDCLSMHLQRPLNTNDIWYYVAPDGTPVISADTPPDTETPDTKTHASTSTAMRNVAHNE